MLANRSMPRCAVTAPGAVGLDGPGRPARSYSVILWIFNAFQFGGLAVISLIGLWMLGPTKRAPPRPPLMDEDAHAAR